jgi:hypothetical protein
MISWNDIFHSIQSDKDYTVKEVVGLGIAQHSVYNALSRGELQKKEVFGKLYVSGKNLKEYISKGIDKV